MRKGNDLLIAVVLFVVVTAMLLCTATPARPLPANLTPDPEPRTIILPTVSPTPLPIIPRAFVSIAHKDIYPLPPTVPLAVWDSAPRALTMSASLPEHFRLQAVEVFLRIDGATAYTVTTSAESYDVRRGDGLLVFLGESNHWKRGGPLFTIYGNADFCATPIVAWAVWFGSDTGGGDNPQPGGACSR